jgi:hypothetical protein
MFCFTDNSHLLTANKSCVCLFVIDVSDIRKKSQVANIGADILLSMAACGNIPRGCKGLRFEALRALVTPVTLGYFLCPVCRSSEISVKFIAHICDS